MPPELPPIRTRFRNAWRTFYPAVALLRSARQATVNWTIFDIVPFGRKRSRKQKNRYICRGVHLCDAQRMRERIGILINMKLNRIASPDRRHNYRCCNDLGQTVIKCLHPAGIWTEKRTPDRFFTKRIFANSRRLNDHAAHALEGSASSEAYEEKAAYTAGRSNRTVRSSTSTTFTSDQPEIVEWVCGFLMRSTVKTTSRANVPGHPYTMGRIVKVYDF